MLVLNLMEDYETSAKELDKFLNDFNEDRLDGIEFMSVQQLSKLVVTASHILYKVDEI
jgi:hypothetical protein